MSERETCCQRNRQSRRRWRSRLAFTSLSPQPLDVRALTRKTMSRVKAMKRGEVERMDANLMTSGVESAGAYTSIHCRNRCSALYCCIHRTCSLIDRHTQREARGDETKSMSFGVNSIFPLPPDHLNHALSLSSLRRLRRLRLPRRHAHAVTCITRREKNGVPLRHVSPLSACLCACVCPCHRQGPDTRLFPLINEWRRKGVRERQCSGWQAAVCQAAERGCPEAACQRSSLLASHAREESQARDDERQERATSGGHARWPLCCLRMRDALLHQLLRLPDVGPHSPPPPHTAQPDPRNPPPHPVLLSALPLAATRLTSPGPDRDAEAGASPPPTILHLLSSAGAEAAATAAAE